MVESYTFRGKVRPGIRVWAETSDGRVIDVVDGVSVPADSRICEATEDCTLSATILVDTSPRWVRDDKTEDKVQPDPGFWL